MGKTRRRLLGCSVVLATAIVACIGASLSTTTQMVITTNHNPFDFGSITVGASGSGSIVISPVLVGETNHIVSISPLSGCSEFAVNPHTLPTDVYFVCGGGETGGDGYGSASCVPVTHTFDVAYTPSGPGSASCNVAISYSTGSGSAAPITSYNVMLIGTGVAPSQGMTVSPQEEIQFGEIRVLTTSANQKVRVKNTGSQSLNITATATGGPTFGVTPPPGPFSLGPGATKDYFVTCTPPTPTEHSGSLSFAAGNLGGSVSYKCRGVNSFLDISPSPVAFDDALVGEPPSNVTVTISNVNEVATEISDIKLDQTAIDAGVTIANVPQLPRTLAPDELISVPLSYAASAEHVGTLGNLNVTETGSPPRTVPISGEALIGEIGTSPSSVDFGPVCAGGTLTREVMVYAAASGDIELASVTKPEAPFDSTTASGTLIGNHGAGVTLMTSVNAATAGEMTGRLVLSSNAPGDHEHEVPMMATVLSPGVGATPATVHFGGAMVGVLTTGKQIVISNCTPAEVEITDARIEGPNAQEFSIVTPEVLQVSLTERAAQTYVLVMSPRSVGSKSAQFVVEHAGGKVIVALDGHGFSDASTEGDRTTYYACNAGGLGGWPVGLAFLGLVRWRRRRGVSRDLGATD
ncbi:MAG: choice-of-anchor D domain-containing protein [Kofleriaceae bacterium]